MAFCSCFNASGNTLEGWDQMGYIKIVQIKSSRIRSSCSGFAGFSHAPRTGARLLAHGCETSLARVRESHFQHYSFESFSSDLLGSGGFIPS